MNHAIVPLGALAGVTFEKMPEPLRYVWENGELVRVKKHRKGVAKNPAYFTPKKRKKCK